MKPGNLWCSARCQIRRQCSKDEDEVRALRWTMERIFCAHRPATGRTSRQEKGMEQHYESSRIYL